MRAQSKKLISAGAAILGVDYLSYLIAETFRFASNTSDSAVGLLGTFGAAVLGVGVMDYYKYKSLIKEIVRANERDSGGLQV